MRRRRLSGILVWSSIIIARHIKFLRLLGAQTIWRLLFSVVCAAKFVLQEEVAHRLLGAAFGGAGIRVGTWAMLRAPFTSTSSSLIVLAIDLLLAQVFFLLLAPLLLCYRLASMRKLPLLQAFAVHWISQQSRRPVLVPLLFLSDP